MIILSTAGTVTHALLPSCKEGTATCIKLLTHAGIHAAAQAQSSVCHTQHHQLPVQRQELGFHSNASKHPVLPTPSRMK